MFLSTKRYSHNLKIKSYFIWLECLVLWAQETASQQLWENYSKETGGEVRLYTSLQQRESEHQRPGIKLRNLAVYVLEDVSLLAHCIHSFHMHLNYLGSILFPCSPCFLHSPSFSAITMGVWQHSLDFNLGSSHPHLEARNCWWCHISCLLILQKTFSFHKIKIVLHICTK